MYRITNSIVAEFEMRHPEQAARIRAAMARRGIADVCNALPPRARNRYVQVFVMESGDIVPHRWDVMGEIFREARA